MKLFNLATGLWVMRPGIYQFNAEIRTFLLKQCWLPWFFWFRLSNLHKTWTVVREYCGRLTNHFLGSL